MGTNFSLSMLMVLGLIACKNEGEVDASLRNTLSGTALCAESDGIFDPQRNECVCEPGFVWRVHRCEPDQRLSAESKQSNRSAGGAPSAVRIDNAAAHMALQEEKSEVPQFVQKLPPKDNGMIEEDKAAATSAGITLPVGPEDLTSESESSKLVHPVDKPTAPSDNADPTRDAQTVLLEFGKSVKEVVRNLVHETDSDQVVAVALDQHQSDPDRALATVADPAVLPKQATRKPVSHPDVSVLAKKTLKSSIHVAPAHPVAAQDPQNLSQDVTPPSSLVSVYQNVGTAPSSEVMKRVRRDCAAAGGEWIADDAYCHCSGGRVLLGKVCADIREGVTRSICSRASIPGQWRSGACRCPHADLSFSPGHGGCVFVRSNSLATRRRICESQINSGKWNAHSNRCMCPDGRLWAAGNCQRQDELSSEQVCVSEPNQGLWNRRSKLCDCPKGTVWLDQKCRAISAVSSRLACAGEVNRGRWSNSENLCMCPGRTHWNDSRRRCL